MRSSRAWLMLLMGIAAAFITSARAADIFPPGPDSRAQPGVPKGELLHFSFDRSKIFPGTFRDYWVYVPAQYDPMQPPCLYVNQDGVQFDAPTVFNNLIAKGEMPVTLGVFIMHGRVKAADGAAALDRFNRSYEYDGLGDAYVRFLIEELLPDVQSKTTSDGRPLRFSMNPDDRAIGGSSSGAVCAFTVAWERPDSFRRVFTSIGTYVGLRGADRYPTLIRKYEPKPIRIFMQDGSNDLNIYAGDWWMENQTMERALTFAGYEVEHVWGEGGHNGNQATAIFPDAMRWLWKDWPQPIRAGRSRNEMLNDLLIPGEEWRIAGEGYKAAGGAAVNANGEVFFDDARDGKTYRIGSDGRPSAFATGSRGDEGQSVGPDGRLYAAESGTREVVARDMGGKVEVIAKGIRGHDLVAAHNGNLYVTEPGSAGDLGKIWLIRPNGKRTLVDAGLQFPTGVALSPDQTLLYVAESRTHWIYSCQVQPDGTLKYKQRYYWLHVPDDVDDGGADGMAVDRDGRLYVATRLGIQICDQAGRVNAILPMPNGKVSSLCFGGVNFDTLYVTSGDRVYARKLGSRGSLAWAAPHKPAAPRL